MTKAIDSRSAINKTLEMCIVEPMDFIKDFFEIEGISNFAPPVMKSFVESGNAYRDAVHQASQRPSVVTMETLSKAEKDFRAHISEFSFWLLDEGENLRVDQDTWANFAPKAAYDPIHMLRSKTGSLTMGMQAISMELQELSPVSSVSGGHAAPLIPGNLTAHASHL